MITLRCSKPQAPGNKILDDVSQLLDIHEQLSSEGYVVRTHLGAFALLIEVAAERDLTWLTLRYTDLEFEVVDRVD